MNPFGDGKCAHGEGAEAFYFYRDGEELEAGVGEVAEAAEVFDDRNVVAEKNCMCRAVAVGS